MYTRAHVLACTARSSARCDTAQCVVVGDDIHYGLFKGDPEKTGEGLKESSQNSVEALAAMAVKCKALEKVRQASIV